MDPLSDVFLLLRVESVLSARIEVSGPWSLRFSEYEHIKFAGVLEGSFWLWFEDGTPPVKLNAGDFYLLTRGQPYCTGSDPSMKPIDGREVMAACLCPDGIVRYGQGGAKMSAAGGRFTLYIDGVPIEDTPMWKLYDDYFITYGNNCASGTLATNPLLGTYTFSRKTSLNQETNGLLDTAEATLSTNPGTLIEIAGSPWGTIGASPATVNVIVGQIVPRGRMVQGLPEI